MSSSVSLLVHVRVLLISLTWCAKSSQYNFYLLLYSYVLRNKPSSTGYLFTKYLTHTSNDNNTLSTLPLFSQQSLFQGVPQIISSNFKVSISIFWHVSYLQDSWKLNTVIMYLNIENTFLYHTCFYSIV